MNVNEIEKLAKELQDYTRVVGSHNKHIQSVANRLVELTEQPQLNVNQQIVFEWLKNKYTITDIEPIELFWRLHVNTKNRFRTLLAYRAYKCLTRKAQLEVLQAFSQWALEQEEEK